MDRHLSSSEEQARLKALRKYDILDTPPDGAFDRIVQLASTQLKVPIAIVSLVDEDRVWFKSKVGVNADQVGHEPGLCVSAILDDQVYWIEQASQDPRAKLHSLVTGQLAVEFYAAAPLITSEGYKLGTICVIDHKPRKFNTDDKALLETLAGMVMDLMETRLASRQAIVEINKLNNLLNDAQRMAKMGAWELDIASGYTQWTEQVYEIYDVDLSFNHNKSNGLDFYHSEYRSVISDALESCIHTEQAFDVVCLFNSAKNHQKWVRVSGFKEPNKGSKGVITGMIQDITVQRQSEEVLLVDKQILQNITNGIQLTRVQDGTIVHASDHFLKMFGYSSQELLGQHVSIINAENEGLNAQERAKEIIRELELHLFWKGEILNRKKNGKDFWCDVTVTTFKHPSHGPVWLAVHQDITKRKKAEDKLRDERLRFAEIIGGTNSGTWEWNVQTGETVFNER